MGTREAFVDLMHSTAHEVNGWNKAGLLNDAKIVTLIKRPIEPMIEVPSDHRFCDPSVPLSKVRYQQGRKVISFGVGSCGFDARLDGNFKVPIGNRVLDVHAPQDCGIEDCFASYTYDPDNTPEHREVFYTDQEVYALIERAQSEEPERANFILHRQGRNPAFYLKPKGVVLAHTVERFQIPPDVGVTVTGKSSYARVFVSSLATPGEPGWDGHFTLEFANHSDCWVPLYLFEGCVQLLFFSMGDSSLHPYGEGKYQNQPGAAITARL